MIKTNYPSLNPNTRLVELLKQSIEVGLNDYWVEAVHITRSAVPHGR